MDGASFGLFGLFVALLLLGYLGVDRSVPFSAMGGASLLGALALLFAANWRANRQFAGPTPPTVS